MFCGLFPLNFLKLCWMFGFWFNFHKNYKISYNCVKSVILKWHWHFSPADLDSWPNVLHKFQKISQSLNNFFLKFLNENGMVTIQNTIYRNMPIKGAPPNKGAPYGLGALYTVHGDQNRLNFLNIWPIFNPKPPLESPESQHLLYDIRFDIAIAPCAFIRHITVLVVLIFHLGRVH